MSIEDVFSIKGRGTVGTGRIERGKCKVGDEVEIIGLMKAPKKTVITGVEMFKKTLEFGVAGDNVGVLLRGIERTDLERGQVLAKPGSITPHTKFEAQVYVLCKDEGGRHTPFFNGYRPQFYFRTTDVTGTVHAAAGRRNVHARRQRQGDGGADRGFADRHGREPAFRHPRRRPHRRFRRRHEDFGVKQAIGNRQRQQVSMTASIADAAGLLSGSRSCVNTFGWNVPSAARATTAPRRRRAAPIAWN